MGPGRHTWTVRSRYHTYSTRDGPESDFPTLRGTDTQGVSLGTGGRRPPKDSATGTPLISAWTNDGRTRRSTSRPETGGRGRRRPGPPRTPGSSLGGKETVVVHGGPTGLEVHDPMRPTSSDLPPSGLRTSVGSQERQTSGSILFRTRLRRGGHPTPRSRDVPGSDRDTQRDETVPNPRSWREREDLGSEGRESGGQELDFGGWAGEESKQGVGGW